jgi:hypothetical protein
VEGDCICIKPVPGEYTVAASFKDLTGAIVRNVQAKNCVSIMWNGGKVEPIKQVKYEYDPEDGGNYIIEEKRIPDLINIFFMLTLTVNKNQLGTGGTLFIVV